MLIRAGNIQKVKEERRQGLAVLRGDTGPEAAFFLFLYDAQ